MSEPNGAGEPGNERLDRIERALNLMLDDHIQFRDEHKLLLNAQVQMHGGMEELRKTMDSLARQMETMSVSIEAMRQNFDQRLKRIEQP